MLSHSKAYFCHKILYGLWTKGKISYQRNYTLSLSGFNDLPRSHLFIIVPTYYISLQYLNKCPIHPNTTFYTTLPYSTYNSTQHTTHYPTHVGETKPTSHVTASLAATSLFCQSQSNSAIILHPLSWNTQRERSNKELENGMDGGGRGRGGDKRQAKAITGRGGTESVKSGSQKS